jgi:DNA-binding NarL/FixJ family response regulator
MAGDRADPDRNPAVVTARASASAPVSDRARDGRRLRVLIVDDHEVVQWGFRLMLGGQAWVERCLAAGNGAQACRLSRRYEPHVAVIDLYLGERSGLEICAQLRALSPWLRVLLISGAASISAPAARAAGAAGFVGKDAPAEEMAEAVWCVGIGGSVFRRCEPSAVWLPARERQVLELMAAGATNPEIGLALHLSRHTIKEHTSSLYRRLGVGNRVQAVRRAQELGLLSPPTGATCARVGAP